MLIKIDVHQSVVAPPIVGVDNAIDVGFCPDNYVGGIGGFGVDTIAAFEQTKDDSPARSTTFTFTANPSETEVKLIRPKLFSQWQTFDASLVHAAIDAQVDIVDRTHRYAGQGGTFGVFQTQRKAATNLTEHLLAFFKVPEISIFKTIPRS